MEPPSVIIGPTFSMIFNYLDNDLLGSDPSGLDVGTEQGRDHLAVVQHLLGREHLFILHSKSTYRFNGRFQKQKKQPKGPIKLSKELFLNIGTRPLFLK